MHKTSEGRNFSRGFGYMRRGSERRDVTIGNTSARHRSVEPTIGASTSPKRTRNVYCLLHQIQHTRWKHRRGKRKKGGKYGAAAWKNVQCTLGTTEHSFL